MDALTELREQLYPPVPWAKGRRPPDVDRSPLPPATEGSQAISGRDLRITCLTILRRHGALCLPELHGLLHRYGYLIAATRPVTALSDAMAYEVEHGRARRVERGVYEATDRPDPKLRTAPPLDAFPPDRHRPTARARSTPTSTRTRTPGRPRQRRFRPIQEPVTNLRPWLLLISPPPRTSSSWPERSSTRARRPSRRAAAPTSTRCSPTTSPTPARPSRRPDRCSTTARSATPRPQITCAFVADAVGELASRLFGREATWGIDATALDGARSFCATYRDPAFLAGLAGQEGRRNLDDDFELVQDTFRRFADEKLTPIAEHIHRHNDDIPEDIISGLAEMGAFGLSIPEEYGGYGSGGESEYIGMVVATEELSRGSLGAGGIADHPPRDPHPGAGQGRHGGAEAALAPPARDGRGDERRGGHRARLRLRRRPA